METGGKRIIVESEEMKAVMLHAEKVSDNDFTVLLLGESGVGKDIAARYIHEHGARITGPFIAVNCGAIPETLFEAELFGHERGAFTNAFITHKGKFEQANTGTILLDEISELPLAMQVKLLRAFENKSIVRIGGEKEIPINARVIAASNRDLHSLAQEGKFRLDLYYRLAVYPKFSLEKIVKDDRLQSIKGFVQMAVDQINERLIICDTEGNRLLVYHVSGNYLSSWGENELGTRGINRPFSIAVSRDRIALVCEPSCVLFLTLNGDYLTELRLEKKFGILSLAWFDQRGNLWLGSNSLGGDNYLRFSFLEYDVSNDCLIPLDFNLINPIGKVLPGKVTTPHILSPIYVAPAKSGFYIKDGFDYKIYFVKYYSKDIQTVIKRRDRKTPVVVEDELIRLTKEAESTGQRLAYFDKYPILKQIFVDDKGNIWVTKYDDIINLINDGNDSHQAYIFDATSRFLGKGKTNILSTRNTTPLFFDNKVFCLSEDKTGGIVIKIFNNSVPLEKRLLP